MKVLRRWSAAALTVLLGCVLDSSVSVEPKPSVSEEASAPERLTDIVTVIALDGVRWQDVLGELEGNATPTPPTTKRAWMPNFHWLATVRGAVLGAPGYGSMFASGPNFVSLPGYMETFTGRRDSSCRSNTCAPVSHRTLADDFAQLESGDPSRVAVFASWPKIARAAAQSPSAVLVSAGRNGTNHPEMFDTPELQRMLVDGDRQAPEPGYGAYRPDKSTAALAVAYLRAKRPRFMFVGLGDTDEHAHHAHADAYIGSLELADEVIGQVAREHERLKAEGHKTLLIVTTDHGRAATFAEHGGAWPESGRVWALAVGDAIAARGPIRSNQRRFLADLTATIRHLAGIPVTVPAGGTPIRELLSPLPQRLASR